MFCCVDLPWRDSSEFANGWGSYPGQRKTGFSPTGANNASAHSGGKSLVSVTVPKGVYPGQTIHVSAPDGSGRLVSAVIPPGMSPGATFLVEFPASVPADPFGTSQPSPARVPIVDRPPLETKSQYEGVSVMAPPSDVDIPYAVATPIAEEPAAPTATPFSAALGPLPNSSSAANNSRSAHQMSSTSPAAYSTFPQQSTVTSGRKYMKVVVPPGVSAGSEIRVRVPGEDRMIAAKVPPGVSEFQVAYDPLPPSATASSSASQGQKLLLVRVPPGTQAGSTIHVNVPGEPGRLLAATVPPNATEFHVSYTPRASQGGSAPFADWWGLW